MNAKDIIAKVREEFRAHTNLAEPAHWFLGRLDKLEHALSTAEADAGKAAQVAEQVQADAEQVQATVADAATVAKKAATKPPKKDG